jgi:hypothetical protein
MNNNTKKTCNNEQIVGTLYHLMRSLFKINPKTTNDKNN